MKLYLFIDGIIMPTAPNAAAVSIDGNGESFNLHDGTTHVILSSRCPESVSVTFKVPDDVNDYEYRDCGMTARDVFDFVFARAASPFEFVLIGVEDKVTVFDINMTVYSSGITSSESAGGRNITVKAKKFDRSEAMA